MMLRTVCLCLLWVEVFLSCGYISIDGFKRRYIHLKEGVLILNQWLKLYNLSQKKRAKRLTLRLRKAFLEFNINKEIECFLKGICHRQFCKDTILCKSDIGVFLDRIKSIISVRKMKIHRTAPKIIKPRKWNFSNKGHRNNLNTIYMGAKLMMNFKEGYKTSKDQIYMAKKLTMATKKNTTTKNMPSQIPNIIIK